MGFRFKDLFWISGEEEPAEGDPSDAPNTLPSSALPPNGLPSNGLPSSALPSSALPSNGLPPNTFPSTVRSAPSLSPPSLTPSSRGVQSVERILHGLKDVDGVIGSLALRADGELVGNNLPALFDQETLERAGQRIAQMCAALSSEADGTNAPKGGALRFDGFQLYINPLPSGTIGVLAEERVNVPALTMAMRVVARQLESFLSSSNAAASS